MAKKQSKELTVWEQKAHAYAKATKASAPLQQGRFLSLKNGVFNKGGVDLGTEMKVIVVGHIHENQWFSDDYDPDTSQIPACFAFGVKKTNEDGTVQDSLDGMKPHEKSTKPQEEECHQCPMNEFGSSDRGKGKACKNVRRIAIIPQGEMEDPLSADLAFMKVPVMSAKNFDGYLNRVADIPYMVFGVICQMHIEKDKKAQFVVKFDVVEKIEDPDILEDLEKLYLKTMKDIDFPYILPEGANDSKPRGKQKKKVRKYA
jgi:hypothetical protein